MTTPPPLLACPFCGGEARTCGPYGWARRWCISHSCAYFMRSASLEFTEFNTEAEAITAWNTRAPNPALEALAAERDALKEALAERDAKAAECPIDKKGVSDRDRARCSVCDATSSEPCGRKMAADYDFTQSARATLNGAPQP